MIGELNKRIVIKRWQDAPIDSADIEHQYGNPVSVWAGVEAVGSVTYWSSQQIGDAVTHRFKMRSYVGVTDVHSLTGQDIIEYGGMRYRIVRVNDLRAERRFTIVECTEINPLGMNN